jgi:hypothetical protein
MKTNILKITVVLALSLALVTVALADNVMNDVTGDESDPFEVGQSTTVNYWIKATGGGGADGVTCNPESATAKVDINTPESVIATPSSLE